MTALRFDPAAIASPRYRVLLLHGDDGELAHERADAVTQVVAGSRDDPFRVSTLLREDHGRLDEEATATSLSGGRRVVRVRDCTDRLLPVLERIAAGPGEALVIAQAGALTRKSKLREWAERDRAVACVACGAESEADRRQLVTGLLARHGLAVPPGAMPDLLALLPPGRAGVAAELEKLALYGDAGPEAMRAVLGDEVEGSLMVASGAALVGDAAGAMASLDRSLAAGGSGVGLTRILGGELVRLGRVLAGVAQGRTVSAALQAARLFNRDPRYALFERASTLWRAADVDAALTDVHRAELACKQTGANESLIASRLVGAVARRARVRPTSP